MRKKPQEKDYLIPVKRKINPGVYKSGYVKELKPDKNGNIKVCSPSGKTTTWKFSNTIHEPNGFKERIIN